LVDDPTQCAHSFCPLTPHIGRAHGHHAQAAPHEIIRRQRLGFYPLCSGAKPCGAHQHVGRSTADRILNVIGHLDLTSRSRGGSSEMVASGEGHKRVSRDLSARVRSHNRTSAQRHPNPTFLRVPRDPSGAVRPDAPINEMPTNRQGGWHSGTPTYDKGAGHDQRRGAGAQASPFSDIPLRK
jgi:hypothetical protein